jgi:hypothetical protein
VAILVYEKTAEGKYTKGKRTGIAGKERSMGRAAV